IPLSCSIPNCTKCDDSQSCQRCQLGYFLYKVPVEFDKDEGIKKDQYVCVECPSYKTSGEAFNVASFNFIPCADCVDNPHKWTNKRICSYQYIKPGNPAIITDEDIFMKNQLKNEKLFYIVLSDGVYKTQICDGCKDFCGGEISVKDCNIVQGVSNENIQQAIICQSGFYFDQEKKKCTKCTQCISMNNQLMCVVCEDGYALNKEQYCIQCSDVITNCSKCFYGDDLGKNYSSDPRAFQQIVNNGTISLRCKYCQKTETIQIQGQNASRVRFEVMMIPSLDLKSCVDCPINCQRCDYSRVDQGNEIHTLNPRVISDVTEQQNYNLRCRSCLGGPSNFINYNGQCETCDIPHCKLCVYGKLDDSNKNNWFYTLSVFNFAIKDFPLSSSVPAGVTKYCGICQNGYQRDSSGNCVIQTISNCVFADQGKCIICTDGWVAMQNGSCSSNVRSDDKITNCGQYYMAQGSSINTPCLTCINYQSQNGNFVMTSNGYADYVKKECSSCDNIGSCSECSQWNWRFLVDEYLILTQPQFDSNQQKQYTDDLDLQETAWCKICPPPAKQNPWTGVCYNCIQSCAECTMKLGYPACQKCTMTQTITSGLNVRSSQSLSTYGCVYCSDYEKSCIDKSDIEKQQDNPFYYNSQRFKNKTNWVKANQCRQISGDIELQVNQYASKNVYYNSETQKCVICSSANGCIKKLTIPYFFDCQLYEPIDISTYFTNNGLGSPTFTGYNVFSIKRFSNQGKNININLRDVLEKDDKFLKYAQEGVEENQIIFDSFTKVTFNNVNISPLFDFDNNADKIPFKILKQIIFETSSFIAEKENLSYSLLRIDLNFADFINLTLIDSYIVNVKNVVRFKASTWVFGAPFSAKSVNVETAVFQTNLLSLQGLDCVKVPGSSDAILIEKNTLFKTPPFSLLITEVYQISHRYTNVKISSVNCELTKNKDDIIQNQNENIATKGGFVNVKSETITFEDVTMTNSVANQGGGIYIECIQDCYVKIFKNPLTDPTYLCQLKSLQTSSNDKVLGEGGAIYIDATKSKLKLEVINCQFENILSRTIGGVFFIDPSSQNVEITITDCTFQNIYSPQGSIISVYIQVVFQQNVAKKSGGGVYFQANDNDQNSILILDGVTFEQNKASQGGAYFLTGIAPTYILNSIKSNIFKNNKASSYGNNNVEYPRKLKIIWDNKEYIYDGLIYNDIPLIENFSSGNKPKKLLVQYLGDDNQLYKANKSAQCTISLNYGTTQIPETAQVSGATTYSVNYDETANSFIFNEVNLNLRPPNTLKIKFTSELIKIPIYLQNSVQKYMDKYDTSYFFPVQVKMRECIIGETVETNGSCYQCPTNKYSLIQYAEICLSCPKIGVDECPGLNVIVVSQGYWRRNITTDLIENCKNLEENCIGGKASQLCYEGHIGALCEVCDIYGEIWDDQWAISGEYTCGKCTEISGNNWKIAIMTIWTFISTFISVKGTINLVQQDICVDTLVKLKFISGGRSSRIKDNIGILIKILTSYFQIISLIFTFGLTIPSFFQSASNTVGNPSKQMSMSMDCFFKEVAGNIPITYFSLIWQLLNPMFFIVGAILGYGVCVLVKKIRHNTGYIWCTCIFLFITLQPSIVSAFITASSCRVIAKEEYIMANVSLFCYSNEHIYYILVLVLPCLIFCIIIIPFLFFIKLHKYKQKLYSDIWTKYKFGYLYMEYQSHAYFWELVKILQKMLLIVFINIYDSDTKVKGVLCFMVVITYTILSSIYEPYADKDNNRLDQSSNQACAISIILGVFLYQNYIDYLVIIGYVSIVIVNLIFLIDIILCIVRGYTKKLDDQIFKQAEKIIPKLNKIPKLQIYFKKKVARYIPIKRVLHLWNFANLDKGIKKSRTIYYQNKAF
ncbi:hypothetical protein IMG5_166610, partial [Ichthyophthirius multifiliis]